MPALQALLLDFGHIDDSSGGLGLQVKGAKTWYLYEADSLPLARDEPFDNSPREDFTKEAVRRKYSGWAAELRQGDMLFLPPYTYHSVRHEGKWNVNVDFACIPDKVSGKGSTAHTEGT
eukprot:scaffold158121_cov43-Prasinocladus_malaysianus.AAC.1